MAFASTPTRAESGNYYLTLNYDGGGVVNFYAGTSFPVTAQNKEFTIQFAQ